MALCTVSVRHSIVLGLPQGPGVRTGTPGPDITVFAKMAAMKNMVHVSILILVLLLIGWKTVAQLLFRLLQDSNFYVHIKIGIVKTLVASTVTVFRKALAKGVCMYITPKTAINNFHINLLTILVSE